MDKLPQTIIQTNSNPDVEDIDYWKNKCQQLESALYKSHSGLDILKKEVVRLQLAIEIANQGIWDWDLKKDIYYHSPHYFKLLGYEPHEISLDFSFWEASLHPNDRKKLIDLELQCLAGELDFYEVDYQMKVKSGQYKWFHTFTKVLEKNAQGRTIHIFGVIKDIEERKKAEEAVQESEEKFRLLVEQNLMAICIYNLDRIIYANPQFLEMFEYKTEDLQNISFVDIIHPDLDDIEWQIVKKNENPQSFHRYQLKTISKFGKMLWMDISTCAIHYNKEQATVATLYDITWRKKYEMELKETNEALRASEEELRQNAEELSAINDNLEKTKNQLEELLDYQKVANFKIENKNLKLYNQKKEIRKTLRQLKQTQEQLIQAEKMASLGVLVAGVAHEINNPVNYLSASCEGLRTILGDINAILIKYGEITPENLKHKLLEITFLKEKLEYEQLLAEAEELIDNISVGASQTAEIVRGLRTFSRLEGNELELVDVHQALDMSLVILQNEYKYNVEIYKEYGNISLVEALSGKLNQVFVNIIANAIDAIKSQKELTNINGEIHIRTYTTQKFEQEMVTIEIEDNGGGIPDSIKNRIFEPFFTTKEVGKGTGLGLAISLGIIENFKGKIEVFSQPEQSTKFVIYLPALS